MTKPLKLAVVGHTNVGKTSLLRTLLRDVGFGEVSHRPSTTRHVEGARLSVEPLAPLVSKYAPDFQNLVNQAMKDLYRDGTARQIYKKWFEQPLPGRGYSLDLPPDMLLNDTFRRPDGFVTDWTVL